MRIFIEKIKSVFDTIKSFRFCRWVEILAIPVFVLVLLWLVEYKFIDGELGWTIVVVVLLVWGVVAGALSVFGTKEWKAVVGLQAVMWLLLFVAGKITKKVDLVLFFDLVIVEAIAFGGSFFVLKKIKDDPKLIMLMITAFIFWLFLRHIAKHQSLDSMLKSVAVDFLFDRIYQSYIDFEEICLLHKLGENKFNKGYFNLYYKRKNIFYRIIYYIACISVVQYNNVYIRKVIDYFWKEYESDTKQILIQYILKYLKDFGGALIIFIILMIIVGTVNYLVAINPKCGKKYFRSIKKINKLVREKKNNFESYTPREKAIILE